MMKSVLLILLFLALAEWVPIQGINEENDTSSQENNSWSQENNTSSQQNDTSTSNSPNHERPCAVCPRHGRCVPRIQCPAVVRPGSYNPECHLDSSGTIGVCCFTGSRQASEQELRQRSAGPDEEDLKTAHHHSQVKLKQWTTKANKIFAESPDTIVNKSSPDYGHHLAMPRYDPRADELGSGALLNLFATQNLKARQAVTDDELSLGLVENTNGPYCPPLPTCEDPQSRYRTIEGECNNLASRNWGAIFTGFGRILPPDYSEGTWKIKVSSSGLPLPNPRLVSATMIPDGNHPSPALSMFFMQWGQFIAHDISAGVVYTADNGSAISCCANDGEDFLPPELMHPACAPIEIEPDDIFFSQYKKRCLNFVRTQIAPDPHCSVGYANQMNGVSHFLDLSHLYGRTVEKAKSLRGSDGLLAVFNDYDRELPPLTSRDECLSTKEGSVCFDSGDSHGNQIISLTVLHTIFTREHNRIVRAFARLNPMWDDHTLYLEARRLVISEFQHIVYNEWLPILLGPQITQIFGLTPSDGYSSSYDPNTNPSLWVEFSAAAMRFGHSTVDGQITISNPTENSVYETISIPELMFQPSRLRLKYFFDRTLIGLSRQPMQHVDPFVTEGLTRYLFRGGNPFGIDLATINILRGRDWGVPSYNEYRRLIGLPIYEDFSQFTDNTAQRLASVYSTPADIDLWVGGLLEEPVEGGIVGPTFAHIIADQFSRLKNGDRYFYDNDPDVNPGAFTPGQLAEIKKVTFARIMCDNRDGTEPFSTPPSVFLRADLPGNDPVTCDSYLIPKLDLSRFKEN